MTSPLTRRRAIALIGGAVGSAASAAAFAPAGPARPLHASATPPDVVLDDPPPNASAYRFRIGDIEATVVSDGQAVFPPHPLYAPDQSQEEVAEAMQAHFLDPAAYVLNANALVLRTAASGLVLVDTGAGSTLGPGLGHLPRHLRAAGFDAAGVAHVVLTHGHLDHTGGIVTRRESGEGVALAFPNATYHVAEAELALWTAADPDLGALALLPEGFRRSFVETARGAFDATHGRLRTFRPGTEVLAGIEAVEAVGHTPGHVGLLVSDGGEALLHVGDVFHHEAFDLAHPEWRTAFDHDPEAAYRVRLRLLDRAAADRALVLAYHAPFPGLGHIAARGTGRYGWEQEPWSLTG